MAMYRVVGVDSSPYTAKVRAVLRYRRLPYQWICRFPQMWEETQHVRPALMPMVQFPGDPDSQYRTDSTLILYALEAAQPQHRSITVPHAGLAFISHLIEDMADEWLTKCLFYYRFNTVEAGDFAARWVMDDSKRRQHPESLARDAQIFRARQVARMGLVGAIPENGPVIEQTYRRVLATVETIAGSGSYLFGSRPALADFGLYAQLRTIGIDPVGMAIMRAHAPRTEHWLRRLDDASGVEGTWHTDIGQLPSAVGDLLSLAGQMYLPFLKANTLAVQNKEESFSAQIGEHPFTTRAFNYQAKCYAWLRDEFNAIPNAERENIRGLLQMSGCLAYFA
ncbi:MAG: glutathione S-transferase [Gammaproteobacteria bacterium]|nr:glutathione S-transferase [Gammaproteobacteria bacterium]